MTDRAQIIGAIVAAFVIVAVSIAVVTAKLGPTSAAELESAEERAKDRTERAEEAAKAEEEAAEEAAEAREEAREGG